MTGRWCVLGRPWFLGAVALLAVNDHVWKQDHPGLVTGKLSDIAGVAVVAAIAATLLGRTRGIVLTGVGFALLKTVPGVAELAAPVLGGVTRRDPFDLIALLALVPVWWTLEDRPTRHLRPRRAAHGAPSPAPSPTAGEPTITSRPAWRRAAGAALPIVGACTALVVTTATSCDPEPAVVRVLAKGPTVYAYVDGGYSGNVWARSDDAGRSWEESAAPPGIDPDAPAGIASTTTSTTGFSTSTTVLSDGQTGSTSSTTEPRTGGPYDDTPLGPVEDCNATECFRLVDGRVIQQSSAGTEQWRDEFVLSDDDAEDIDTGCSGGTKGVLTSVAVTEGRGGAVVSLGAAGVVTRDGDGSWTRHRVLDADIGDEPSPFTSPVLWIVVGAGPLGMAAAWVLGRRGTALRILGTVAVAVGIVVIVGGTFTFWSLWEEDVVFGRVQIILAATVVVVGLGLSAFSRSPSTPARPFVPPQQRPQPRRPNPPAR